MLVALTQLGYEAELSAAKAILAAIQEKTVAKNSIFPEQELLNELMELNQERERPLASKQSIRVLQEIDGDSDGGVRRRGNCKGHRNAAV